MLQTFYHFFAQGNDMTLKFFEEMSRKADLKTDAAFIRDIIVSGLPVETIFEK
jgi:hypothetical protein